MPSHIYSHISESEFVQAINFCPMCADVFWISFFGCLCMMNKVVFVFSVPEMMKWCYFNSGSRSYKDLVARP